LTNIASRDELVDYVVPPGESGDDIEEIIDELQNVPEVSMVVVTGPSTAIADYLEAEPGVSANVLAVDFYNWSDGICGR
jgi:inosine-uridine nucleoside N-ribohydrolase